jgi:uncharacterized protein (TIGR02271 family)
MDLTGKIRRGMWVFGADNRELGTVERHDGEYVYVGGRRLPMDAFERVEDDRLYVGEAGRRSFAGADARDASEIRVPIAEERLDVDKRPVELGEVRLHKRVDQVEQVVREPVTRTDVEIERVKANRRVEGPVGPREEGEWIVVPIVEELLVVRKVLMVTEEVRIRRRPVTEVREVRETVRRERVEVEDTTGGAAGHREADAREAEPDLGRGAGSDRPGGEGWEPLLEEIRGGPKRPGAPAEAREE